MTIEFRIRGLIVPGTIVDSGESHVIVIPSLYPCFLNQVVGSLAMAFESLRQQNVIEAQNCNPKVKAGCEPFFRKLWIPND